MTFSTLPFGQLAVAALVGLFAWTLAEYLLHRFVMHELGGRGLPSREHLLHHADPEHNQGRPILSWVGIALIGLVVFVPLGSLLGGATVGWAALGGWLLGYGTYRRIHNRSHSHAPRGGYGRWVRVHHFHHHHGHPMANHGVTSPLWDRVFGTLEVPGVIRVPRRHAMPWLVAGDGTVLPEFADHYALVGPAAADARLAGIDRARAFANLTPQPDRPD